MFYLFYICHDKYIVIISKIILILEYWHGTVGTMLIRVRVLVSGMIVYRNYTIYSKYYTTVIRILMKIYVREVVSQPLKDKPSKV
jgi:hypothetical protein